MEFIKALIGFGALSLPFVVVLVLMLITERSDSRARFVIVAGKVRRWGALKRK